MLFVVSTPIGNLEDITFRAVATLREVDLVAAEDTRHAQILLNHYQIRKPLVSFHEHNEARRTQELAAKLSQGERVALLTDAGMPSISDPGYRLVSACRRQGLPVTVLPGPSAVLTALVGSGLPTDSFYFGGFIPVKSGQRRSELERATSRDVTSVYFETPHRLIRSLEVLAELAPDRLVCVARELTKRFEEFVVRTPGLLLEQYAAHPPRGEITLVIAPLPRRKARGQEAATADPQKDDYPPHRLRGCGAGTRRAADPQNTQRTQKRQKTSTDPADDSDYAD